MNANANIVDPFKGNSTLVRPRFSPGLLLRDDDLTSGVEYTRDLSRLLFRSLFGCGVVCGLTVSAKIQCGKLVIIVNQGVALNGMGDPIYVPRPSKIVTDLGLDPECGKPIPKEIWVTLCRLEKCCAPRSTVCGCDDDEDNAVVCTREHDWFEIRLVTEVPEDCICRCDLPAPVAPSVPAKGRGKKTAAGTQDAARVSAADPGCACVDPCDPCYQDHYAGKCECECCSGECVVLGLLTMAEDLKATNGSSITLPVDYRVRRFVRPVLMRDPEVWQQLGNELCPSNTPAPPPPPAPPPVIG